MIAETKNFGSVMPTADAWIVRCEPHVRSRLKRVFPRAPQHAADTIRISATPENSRDLLWFLARYPMQVAGLPLLEDLAREHEQMEEQIVRLHAGDLPRLDFAMALPPREYQGVAAQLVETTGGLLIADDVGLGKTVTAICSLVLGENRPAVVVCPTHLPQQWQGEIARFAPTLSTHVVTKGTPYSKFKIRRGAETSVLRDALPDVIITNYHKLRGWAETLAGVCKTVVFDECQQLRGPTSEIYAAAEHVAGKARRRVGLSATPIYNYGAEFYHVVNILRPGALGEHGEFIREWCIAGARAEKARISNTREFGAYLRREGIMLRRRRVDVGRELPDLQKVVHPVASNASEIAKVKGNAVALARIIVAANESYRGQKMQAAGEFDAMMRQATGVAKAGYVAEFVRMLMESETRIVLFGWHREVYAIWLEALREFNPRLYTGSESPTQKAAAIEAFTNGTSRLLIMSLRSGAGVDGLQGVARTVVFGELDWSPGVHEQCVGRVHRDGQDEPCVAYFLVSEHGADPVMIDVLGVKREQIEGVRNPDRGLVERVDLGENNLRRLARELLRERGEAESTDTNVLEMALP